MKKYRVVQAGCGGISRLWIDAANARDDLEMVGLVDLDRAAAEKRAQEHGLPSSIVFDTLDEALLAAKPDIVFDITVPSAHYEVTMKAIAAGCHVFGEKPMADSMEHAREMVAAAKAAGKMYAIMQNRRYLRPLRGLRAAIEAGTIGDVSTVNADFYLGTRFPGFRQVMDSPLLLDMAIHTFDKARFVSDADPVAVYCHEFNPKGSWYKGNVSAICVFEMTNDIVFSYRGSWCAKGLNTSWESEWRIQGAKGSAKWDGATPAIAEVSTSEEDSHKHDRLEIPEAEMPSVGHEACVDAMMTALHEGRDAETDCADNIKSLAMVFGAIESARAGRRVEIEV